VRRPGVLIVLVSAIWGSSYLLIKVALHDLSAEAIVFARVACGALVLVPIAWRAGALRGLGPYLGRLAVVALLQITAPVWLIALGEQWISSALAGLLNGSVPIFVALFALVVDRAERATRARVAGIALGLAGVALVLGVDVRLGLFTLVGAGCLTGASIGYALGPLYAKRHLGGLRPVGIVAALMAFATLYTLPGLVYAPPRHVPRLETVTAVAALGVVGTGLGFLLYYQVMQRIGPGRASVIGYLVTGFAVVYGVVLLGEHVGPGGVAGLGLIVAGSVVASRAQGLPARLRERQAAS
jgi:drug/metabolite transporter (DMT)-like permease